MPNTQDEIQRETLARAILANCALRHGGTAALSRHLGIEEGRLLDWMGGKENPPVEIVRKAAEPFLKADQ